MLPNCTLVLGGASSGKSSLAEGLATASGLRRVYIATAQGGDAEMTAKIRRHLAQRGDGWQTIEAPLDVAAILAARTSDQVVLLDCATMWLSNHMQADNDLIEEQARLIKALAACPAKVITVSNEVGQGGVSQNALARRFGRVQGGLNIALAAQADLVVQVIAGLPNVLKGNMP